MKPAQSISAEHIRMPGFPQLIVTRGYAYQYLSGLGCYPDAHGFGSVDYAVFAPPAVAEPLTDAETLERWLEGATGAVL